MKIAILQFDERIDNKTINEVLNVNRQYCKLHGYDHIFKALKDEDTHQHQLDDYMMDNKNKKNILALNVYDYRIHMIEQYMNDYDYLVYFDTDLIVSNPNIKIEDLIDDEHDIFMFTDMGKLNSTIGILMIAQAISMKLQNDKIQYFDDPLKELLIIENYNQSAYDRLCNIVLNPQGLASGFLIINCHSKKLKSFIEDFRRFYPLFEHGTFDQGCIATLLRMSKYKEMLKILPTYLHGCPFSNIIPEFRFNVDKAFVCHFYGSGKNIEDIWKYIEDIKANKWWSQVNTQNN